MRRKNGFVCKLFHARRVIFVGISYEKVTARTTMQKFNCCTINLTFTNTKAAVVFCEKLLR